MIDAILIDDEAHCLTALRYDLGMFCPQVNILASCASAREGIMEIRSRRPQLVFLDIQMPVMNGFDMLGALGRDLPFQVIFTTAHDNFASRAFRAAATDYLLKPIDGAELAEAVSRAERRLGQPLPSHAGPPENAAGPKKVVLPSRDGYEFLEPASINYCKADGAYTVIALTDGKSLLISKALGEMEHSLPSADFLRIHHSVIINIRHVRQFRKSEGSYVIMENGVSLHVARSRKQDLLARLHIR